MRERDRLRERWRDLNRLLPAGCKPCRTDIYLDIYINTARAIRDRERERERERERRLWSLIPSLGFIASAFLELGHASC